MQVQIKREGNDVKIDDGVIMFSAATLLQEINDIQIIENWNRVDIPRNTYYVESLDIKQWCLDNIDYKWKNFTHAYFFEHKDDAMKFKLVWG